MLNWNFRFDNGVNGVPSCMNGPVNNGVVRDQWGLGDGVIVSDCGAVGDTFATAYIRQRFGGTPEAQVQQGLRGGCDFNCGTFYQQAPFISAASEQFVAVPSFTCFETSESERVTARGDEADRAGSTEA